MASGDDAAFTTTYSASQPFLLPLERRRGARGMNEALHPHHFAHPPLPTHPHLFHSNAPAPQSLVSPEFDSLNFFDEHLTAQPDLAAFDPSTTQFDAGNVPRFQQVRSNAPVNTFPPQQNVQATNYGIFPRPAPPRQPKEPANGVGGGQFGILTPHPQLPSQPQAHQGSVGQTPTQTNAPSKPVASGGSTMDGHFGSMRMELNPPDLEYWRKKLFDVDETITMTEDQFKTYFPHVDNIYSHRSTQNHKRKPFISHYWDCRLKGRPPGTAKSEDPNKKKRKRQARERDLCDVKIKVTEHIPERRVPAALDSHAFVDSPTVSGQQRPPASAILRSNDGLQQGPASTQSGTRYYTIQRVNGSGLNGKDGPASGGHKHTLEESDRLKKNSILRFFLKEEKVKRQTQKTYHKKATGPALNTVKKHSKEHELKLYGSCFCPFVQRVWISLELKGLPYQYIEVDPYRKPAELLALNPRGLIPALAHDSWSCYESSVLMEYLEDLNTGYPLLPATLDARARAHSRLWTDHVNRRIVPLFYAVLQAQETQRQIDKAGELKEEIAKLVEAADPAGPFFLGGSVSFVDVQFAPWMLRLRRVLKPYRGWPDPEPGSRWAAWVDAVEGNEGIKATVSGDELYVDSYERYAENRPDTSQVAKAINEGTGLP